ncbi:MAG TPA: CPBP family intramembrane glutamic endopeptidase [Planctomycetota bacterium]|nr:CPBP family intramembrane glutamic endopeptidase [Planctomycetota bacterium]
MRAPRAGRWFAGAWALAAATLLAIGEWKQVLMSLALLAGVLVFSALTFAITDTPPFPRWEAPRDRRRLGIQTAIVLGVIALTGYSALAFHGVISRAAGQVPLWRPMVEWVGRLGERALPPGAAGSPFLAVSNPFQYFVVPMAALLLAGAKPRDLGLTLGHRTWRVTALWCAIPVIFGFFAFVLLTGYGVTARDLGRRVLSNTFQNGFFEEFLFRGALQTRLAALYGSPIALVAQALLFGLWHLGADVHSRDGNVVAGLAATIVVQGTSGLGLGVIFERTRSLIAPSIVHVVSNCL